MEHRPSLLPPADADDYDDFSELERERRENDMRLKTTFERIFDKYSRDFSNIGDEIDLETGEIVVDNGHLAALADERDTGETVGDDWDEEDEDDTQSDKYSVDAEEDAEMYSDDDRDEIDILTPTAPPASRRRPHVPTHREQRTEDRPHQRRYPQNSNPANDPAFFQALGQSIAQGIAQYMTQYQGNQRSTDPVWDAPPLPSRPAVPRRSTTHTHRRRALLESPRCPPHRSIWAGERSVGRPRIHPRPVNPFGSPEAARSGPSSTPRHASHVPPGPAGSSERNRHAPNPVGARQELEEDEFDSWDHDAEPVTVDENFEPEIPAEAELGGDQMNGDHNEADALQIARQPTHGPEITAYPSPPGAAVNRETQSSATYRKIGSGRGRNWSKDDDELLAILKEDRLLSFAKIGRYFPERSSRSIENRWYNHLQNRPDKGTPRTEISENVRRALENGPVVSNSYSRPWKSWLMPASDQSQISVVPDSDDDKSIPGPGFYLATESASVPQSHRTAQNPCPHDYDHAVVRREDPDRPWICVKCNTTWRNRKNTRFVPHFASFSETILVRQDMEHAYFCIRCGHSWRHHSGARYHLKDPSRCKPENFAVNVVPESHRRKRKDDASSLQTPPDSSKSKRPKTNRVATPPAQQLMEAAGMISGEQSGQASGTHENSHMPIAVHQAIPHERAIPAAPMISTGQTTYTGQIMSLSQAMISGQEMSSLTHVHQNGPAVQPCFWGRPPAVDQFQQPPPVGSQTSATPQQFVGQQHLYELQHEGPQQAQMPQHFERPPQLNVVRPLKQLEIEKNYIDLSEDSAAESSTTGSGSISENMIDPRLFSAEEQNTNPPVRVSQVAPASEVTGPLGRSHAQNGTGHPAECSNSAENGSSMAPVRQKRTYTRRKPIEPCQSTGQAPSGPTTHTVPAGQVNTAENGASEVPVRQKRKYSGRKPVESRKSTTQESADTEVDELANDDHQVNISTPAAVKNPQAAASSNGPTHTPNMVRAKGKAGRPKAVSNPQQYRFLYDPLSAPLKDLSSAIEKASTAASATMTTTAAPLSVQRSQPAVSTPLKPPSSLSQTAPQSAPVPQRSASATMSATPVAVRQTPVTTTPSAAARQPTSVASAPAMKAISAPTARAPVAPMMRAPTVQQLQQPTPSKEPSPTSTALPRPGPAPQQKPTTATPAVPPRTVSKPQTETPQAFLATTAPQQKPASATPTAPLRAVQKPQPETPRASLATKSANSAVAKLAQIQRLQQKQQQQQQQAVSTPQKPSAEPSPKPAPHSAPAPQTKAAVSVQPASSAKPSPAPPTPASRPVSKLAGKGKTKAATPAPVPATPSRVAKKKDGCLGRPKGSLSSPAARRGAQSEPRAKSRPPRRSLVDLLQDDSEDELAF